MANKYQLVELMHGGISLESKLGVGTKASFWIPFNKAQYQGVESPIIDPASIPDRLKSDVSVSGAASEDRGTPPPTPHDMNLSAASSRSPKATANQASTSTSQNVLADRLGHVSAEQRKNTHVLVVEDK